jgi:hypothetical protein
MNDLATYRRFAEEMLAPRGDRPRRGSMHSIGARCRLAVNWLRKRNAKTKPIRPCHEVAGSGDIQRDQS